jgi:hypothetical protein
MKTRPYPGIWSRNRTLQSLMKESKAIDWDQGTFTLPTPTTISQQFTKEITIYIGLKGKRRENLQHWHDKEQRKITYKRNRLTPPISWFPQDVADREPPQRWDKQYRKTKRKREQKKKTIHTHTHTHTHTRAYTTTKHFIYTFKNFNILYILFNF